jgi:hypothetical protein
MLNEHTIPVFDEVFVETFANLYQFDNFKSAYETAHHLYPDILLHNEDLYMSQLLH